MRLFCSPYAGGNSVIFQHWANALPANVELHAIHLPGRGARLKEPCFTQLFPLVNVIADSLLPYLDKPFAFFGHSMGGLINFELARELRRRYRLEPVHLFISGRQAPQVPNRESILHNLAEPAFIEEMRRLNGTPPTVLENPDLLELLIPLLRADFEICETYAYVPGKPLNCSITALGGVDDQDVSAADLEAWREQTTAKFSLRLLPGDHFFLHTAEALLFKILCEELDQHLRPASRN
jgi:surfactin synthase thioesterase subunit